MSHSASAIALNNLLMQETVMSPAVQRAIYSRPTVDLFEAHAVSDEKFPDTNIGFLIELFERIGMLSFRCIDKDEFYANLSLSAQRFNA